MSWYRNSVFLLKGLTEFGESGYQSAAKHFKKEALDPSNPHPLKDKHAIITGANSGIGFQVSLEYARLGGSVHLICRNKERGAEAQQKIKEEAQNENVFLHIVDVGRPLEIVEFVENYNKTFGTLNVLVNNAGTMENERTYTPENFEVNFSVHVVGAFLLTELLIPIMSASQSARVITVSSAGMLTMKLDPVDLNCEKMEPFDGTFVYAQHKRRQVELTNCWAHTYKDTGVKFWSCHPGWTDTPALRAGMPNFYDNLKNRLRSVEHGADTIVWLASSDDALSTVPSGAFVQDRKEVSQHLTFARTRSTDDERKILYDKMKEILKQYQKSSD